MIAWRWVAGAGRGAARAAASSGAARRGLCFASAPIPTTCRSRTAPARDSRTGSPSCWPPIGSARLEYTWWAQRRGFVRNTLAAGALRCRDRRAASASSRSRRRGPTIDRATCSSRGATASSGLESLDDPRLRGLRIGVQMIGDDFSNTPPAHALASRGITRNVVGYSGVRRLCAARARCRDDRLGRRSWRRGRRRGLGAGRRVLRAPAAAARSTLTPVSPRARLAVAALRVRHLDGGAAWRRARRAELDDFLVRRRADVDAILDRYGVPRVEGTGRADAQVLGRVERPDAGLSVGLRAVAAVIVLLCVPPPRRPAASAKRAATRSCRPLPTAKPASASAALEPGMAAAAGRGEESLPEQRLGDGRRQAALRRLQLRALPRRQRRRRDRAAADRRQVDLRRRRRIRSTRRSRRGVPTACRRSAGTSRRSRSGSWWPTCSRCPARSKRPRPPRATTIRWRPCPNRGSRSRCPCRRDTADVAHPVDPPSRRHPGGTGQPSLVGDVLDLRCGVGCRRDGRADRDCPRAARQLRRATDAQTRTIGRGRRGRQPRRPGRAAVPERRDRARARHAAFA